MHVEGAYSSKSLAWINNNPGNIEDPSGNNPGRGQLFRKYPTKLDGFNALVADIAANKGRVLMSFINKYAPPCENDTTMYLNTVCGITGMSPADTL